jgi:hypothetical protein
VCTTFQTGTTPTGTVIDVIGGDVTSSASNMIRSTLNLTTLHAWPDSADDPLAPYGQEIYIEKGLKYGNGQTEHVGLGYFRINTPEQDEVPDGPITIAGADRMAGIVDARFLTPRQFGATMTRGQFVIVLINEVYPSAVIEWDDTGLRDGFIGRTIIAEEDRAQTLLDFVTSLGKIGYFDHRGIYVIKTAPDPEGPPLWTIDAGEDGVLVRMSRSLTREGVCNVMVATGEAGDTTPPARGLAVNLDPASPTYYLGPFGPVPRFFSSPFLTTNSQAAQAARQILAQHIGLPYQIDLDSIVNAAIEPFDPGVVKYPETSRNRSLRSETHVVDEVKIPLTHSEGMTIKTREQSIILIGDPS